jgi:hypothetical protein
MLFSIQFAALRWDVGFSDGWQSFRLVKRRRNDDDRVEVSPKALLSPAPAALATIRSAQSRLRSRLSSHS